MIRYNRSGKPDINGKYELKNNKLKKLGLIKLLRFKLHSARQNKMLIPTDPEFIKDRANKIRQEINEQKQKRYELSKLNQDIELIKFHARMNGKLKPDDLDYNDQREKQDTKDFLDNLD